MNRIGGTIFVKADSFLYRAKGSWTYNIGENMREGIAGADSVHGYKEMPQVPFIEGVITDHNDMSLQDLLRLDNVTVTLELANDKVIVLREAWFAGEGSVTTEEGEVGARFEGIDAEEVR